MTETPVRDRWLFLTPEAEAELPPAVAALAAALGEHGRAEDDERSRARAHRRGRRISGMARVPQGTQVVLERYVDRHGEDALSRHVADVLMNHWLLALTVPGQEPRPRPSARASGRSCESSGS